MVVRAAHASRESQPVHDDGRRSHGDQFEPGILGVAVEIDQDIDPVPDDLLGGGLVVHFANVDPMIDRAFYSGIRRVAYRYSAIVGENLDPFPVVEFEYLGRQEPDGVLPQIGRQVADAQRLGALAVRHGPVSGGEESGIGGDLLLVVTVRIGHLQQRVIGIGRYGKRGNRPHQRGPGHIVPRRHHRPFALPLPEREVVLDDVMLVRVDLQTLPQGVFGMLVDAAALENAANLLECHDLVADRGAGDAGQPPDDRIPLKIGLVDRALAFEQGSQIDIRRDEIGIEGNRLFQRFLGAVQVVEFAEHHAEIEIDGIAQRICGVVIEPDLVEFDDELAFAACLQSFGKSEQLGDVQPPFDNPLHPFRK